MNDPNGLIEIDGVVHLFYQYNPHAPVWHAPHWGHATSSDLVSWADRPIALRPDSRFDSAGCFSGCCVLIDGTPTIFYTGVVDLGHRLHERVLRATSTDGLVTWHKDDLPMVDGGPPGIPVTGFRDPSVWHDGTSWRMIVGSGTAAGGMILQYRSPDGAVWHETEPLLTAGDLVGDHGFLGDMWECPQVVQMDGSDVLLVSVHRGAPSHVVGFVGTLVGERFIVSTSRRIDAGPSLYAPQVLIGPDRDPRLFGWLREDPTTVAHGWSGAMSLPRALVLDGDRLLTPLAPEIAALVQRPAQVTRSGPLVETETLAIGGGAVLIDGTLTATGSATLAVDLEDGDSRVVLRLGIAIDTTGEATWKLCAMVPGASDSCTEPMVTGPMVTGPMVTVSAAAGPTQLEFALVIDASIAELFAGSGQGAAVRLPGDEAEIRAVRLRPLDGTCEVSLAICKLALVHDETRWTHL